MIRAIGVVANDDYSIEVRLEDGRDLKMDMKFLTDESGPVVDPLKKIMEFKKVFIRNGIVTWPTGYDIDPYFLLEQGSIITRTA